MLGCGRYKRMNGEQRDKDLLVCSCQNSFFFFSFSFQVCNGLSPFQNQKGILWLF